MESYAENAQVVARPRMRAELEILTGMDGHDLIFDPATGSYHRLSPASLAVVRVLDGSRTVDEVTSALGAGVRQRAAEMRPRVEEFVSTLAARGLLEGTQPVGAGSPRRYSASRLMPRFVLVRNVARLLEPVAARTRCWPDAVGYLLCALAIVGFSAGLVAVMSRGATFDVASLHGVGVVLLATVVQVVAVAGHEASHALVAQQLGVPVRGFGVALLFYVLPVAYVDRTDAYRLESRRDRIAISVAGMVHDGILTGLLVLLSTVVTGTLGQVVDTVLMFQLIMLAVNLNPLLPSDGYSAMEIALGVVDARGRSATLLKHVVLRRELPAHLRALTARGRLAYGVFGAVCATYVVVVVGLVLTHVVNVVEVAAAGAGR